MSPTHADPDRVGTLHHVELCASNLAEAVDFWEWLLVEELDYERKNDWVDGRSWLLDATYLVVKAAETDDALDRLAPGLNHLAFHADSRAAVDRISETVRAREDASLLYEDKHPYAGGYYAVYFEGPDGLKLEVVAPEAD